jgi:hypothetical protein
MSYIDSLHNVISVTINEKHKDHPPTYDEVLETASLMRNTMNPVFPVSDDEFKLIIQKITASIIVTMDDGVYIFRDDNVHKSWYPNARASIDMFYWTRFSKYLVSTKRWNSRVVAQLNKVTDEVMDLLGDPRKEGGFQRRGLLLGDVQSGKTANYTAICNKAADCGYKVIIVLAGIMENLRVQTQERLDAEFAGRKSRYLLDPTVIGEIRNQPHGVGLLTSRIINKRIACFTSVNTDFSATIVRSNDLSLRNITEPSIFIVKKNKTVLNNLYEWLLTNNSDEYGKIDLPMLLIDDEADNASINTNKEDQNPTAINEAIRKILNIFTRSSYIGITATPYANIFINPESNSGGIDDLFPRDFIYVLPTPSNYIGPDALFGFNTNLENEGTPNRTYSSSILRISNNELENILPFKHKKDIELSELPYSLYEATRYFLLVNVARDYRLELKTHRSMLINVSRFTNIHEKIAILLEDWFYKLKMDLRSYSRLDKSKWMKIESIFSLYLTWNSFNFSELLGISWDIVLSDYILKSIEPIEIKTVNQRTGSASLNYSLSEEEGFRVIAIGGNSLSRGLTLEGLCVSYFYRNSLMYDTLLQMGRWFGYRNNYEDLFKIWMAEDALGWFGLITDATNELKIELQRMRALNQTPEQFGLKVRQDPNSLIVTARNKMRTATQITIPVEVSGRVVETPRLKPELSVLQNNEQAFRDFVKMLDENGVITNQDSSTLFWRDIPKMYISSIVRNFDVHPWHLAFQGVALADYIDTTEGLDLWDVAFAQGQSTDSIRFETSQREIYIHPADRKVSNDGYMIRIGGSKVRVGSGGQTKIGLDENIVDDIKQKYKGDKVKLNQSDSMYLIPGRKPIMFLHCIKWTASEGIDPMTDLLYAIGLGFPSTGKAVKTASYVINTTDLKYREGRYYIEEDYNDVDD